MENNTSYDFWIYSQLEPDAEIYRSRGLKIEPKQNYDEELIEKYGMDKLIEMFNRVDEWDRKNFFNQ
jgi:hypothetical protein